MARFSDPKLVSGADAMVASEVLTCASSGSSDDEPVHLFTIGGTIDKVYSDFGSGYEVGTPVVEDLLRHARVSVLCRIEPLIRKDSLDLTDEDRELIRSAVGRSTFRRVVVTHGTDTMDSTARSLADLPGKVIVLTGAFLPARFVNSDAAFNVGLALGAVQVLPCGVYIAMNGRIFDGTRARKDRELMRFVEA